MRRVIGMDIHRTFGKVVIWDARHHLLEIVEDRYGNRSTLVTGQLPVTKWHELIGDATYADAILDRLVHNAHRITLEGDSLRRPHPQTA